MGQMILVIMALATGAMIPLQLAFNGQLGTALKGPVMASFFVFLTGVVATGLVLLIARTPLPDMATMKAVPVSAWVGGIIATLYILAVVYLVPKLGVGSAAVLIIAGQLVTALVLDHLGAFGTAQDSISWLKAAGAGLVLTGAALVKFA
jgi:transporter family-2 protein